MPALFIMRHAIAEDRDSFAKQGLADDLRPLTAKGINRLHKVCSRLTEALADTQVIFQSPLARSIQTVEILHRYLPNATIKTSDHLAPDAEFSDLLKELKTFKGKNLLLVGHEDHLSRWTHYLLTGKKGKSFFEFKKAGVARLMFEGALTPGNVQFEWLLTPRLTLDID